MGKRLISEQFMFWHKRLALVLEFDRGEIFGLRFHRYPCCLDVYLTLIPMLRLNVEFQWYPQPKEIE